MAMTLKIVTPTRQIVDAEVSEVTAPGSLGEFGVLPEHATFLGELGIGPLRYLEAGERKTVIIYGGYAEVAADVVTILANDAELPTEIDAAEARAEQTHIEEKLAQSDLETVEVEQLLQALRLAEVRVSEAT